MLRFFRYVMAALAALIPFTSNATDQDRTLAIGQFGVWGAFAAEWRKKSPKTRECYVILNKPSSNDAVLIITSRVALDHKGPVEPQIIISGGSAMDGPAFVDDNADISMVFDDGAEVAMEVANQQIADGTRFMDVAVAPEEFLAAINGIAQSGKVRARNGDRIFFEEDVDGFADAYAHITPHCRWPAVTGQAGG